MDEKTKTTHKPETRGRETTYTEEELAEAVIHAAFSQFVQPATRDSGEGFHA